MSGHRGRPRNVEAQNAILSASYELLLESGFQAVTVDKIAERAQVSKATIYKWWPNKAAVVMDGFLYAATARLPVPDTDSAIQDIVTHATNLTRFLTSQEGTIITQLLGEGQFDSGLAEAYRTRFFRPRRLEARGLIEKAIQLGEFRQDIDIDVCIDLLYGPIFYRLLVTGMTLDDTYVHQLIHYAIEGVRSR